MREFLQWFDEQRLAADQAWLILGKGPSFAKRHAFDLTAYKTISLNHAVREQRVDLAHLIDLDVLHDCAEEIETNAAMVVMPWVPHVNCFAGNSTLDELV